MRRLCLALAGIGQALSIPAADDWHGDLPAPRQARQEARSEAADDWYGVSGSGSQETAIGFVEVTMGPSFDLNGFREAVATQLQTMTELFDEVKVPSAWVIEGQDGGDGGDTDDGGNGTRVVTVVGLVSYEGNVTAVDAALRQGIQVTYDGTNHTGFAFRTSEVLFEADYATIDPALWAEAVNRSLAAAGADVGAVKNISVSAGSVIVALDYVASTNDPDGTGAADIDEIIDDPDGLVVSYDGASYAGVRYRRTTSTASTSTRSTTHSTHSTPRTTPTTPYRPAPDVAFTGEGIPLTTTKLLVAAGAAGTVAFFLFIVLLVAQVKLHWSGSKRTRTIAMVSSAPDVGFGGDGDGDGDRGGDSLTGSLLPARGTPRYGTMANHTNQTFRKGVRSPGSPRYSTGDTDVDAAALPGSDTKSTASWRSETETGGHPVSPDYYPGHPGSPDADMTVDMGGRHHSGGGTMATVTRMRRSFDQSFERGDHGDAGGEGAEPFDPEDYLTFAESTTGNLKIL